MGIGFNGNDYGITRKEWKAFKKELKSIDKKDDSFELTKADYKEIKAHIKTGDLGAYMDTKSAEIRNAMGLSLSGKVDSTEDIKGAQAIVNNVDFAPTPDGKPTDKAKVMQYISLANTPRIAESFKEGATNFERVATESHLSDPNGLFAELFT